MTELIDLIINEYLIQGIVALVILILILLLLISRLLLRLNLKRQIKRYKRLRKKKFNGDKLLKKIEKKRKRKTNSYKHLKRKGKSLVDHFINYKEKELIDTAKYVNAKGLKKPKAKLSLSLFEGGNIIETIDHKNFVKKIKKLMNTYDCLDETIFFLHHLPKEMLDEKLFTVNITEQITISYDVN